MARHEDNRRASIDSTTRRISLLGSIAVTSASLSERDSRGEDIFEQTTLNYHPDGRIREIEATSTVIMWTVGRKVACRTPVAGPASSTFSQRIRDWIRRGGAGLRGHQHRRRRTGPKSCDTALAKWPGAEAFTHLTIYSVPATGLPERKTRNQSSS